MSFVFLLFLPLGMFLAQYSQQLQVSCNVASMQLLWAFSLFERQDNCRCDKRETGSTAFYSPRAALPFISFCFIDSISTSHCVFALSQRTESFWQSIPSQQNNDFTDSSKHILSLHKGTAEASGLLGYDTALHGKGIAVIFKRQQVLYLEGQLFLNLGSIRKTY